MAVHNCLQPKNKFVSDLQIRNYKTPMMVWYKWLTSQQLDPQDYHHAEWAQIKESEEVQILTLIPSDQKVPESLIDFKSQTVISQLKDS